MTRDVLVPSVRPVCRRCISSDRRDGLLENLLTRTKSLVFDVVRAVKSLDEDMAMFMAVRVMKRLMTFIGETELTEYLQLTLTFCDNAFNTIESLAKARQLEVDRGNASVLQDVVIRLRWNDTAVITDPPNSEPIPSFKHLTLVIDYHDTMITPESVNRMRRLIASDSFTLILWLHGANTRIDSQILRWLRENMQLGIFHG